MQQQHGYVTKAGLELAAEVLGTTPAYVDSVSSFYTMLYRQPVGKYVLQVCRTLPCAPHGSWRGRRMLAGKARHQAG